MKQVYLILLFGLINVLLVAQESIYFNNVYQKQNNFAIGMTILETEDGYVGYGGTEDPSNIGQMILLYKINKQGEEMLWKSIGENYHNYYYGNVGGAMIKTNDGNFAMACHYVHNGETYGTIIKLNGLLDTIWKRDYNLAYKTIVINCIQTKDNGYLLSGWIYLLEGDVSNPLLIKTDSLGNYHWHQVYGGDLADRAQNVIESPDGGYLIGGLIWNPSVYHSLDALLIKTDSLGNEQWTQTYGNPDVDDDMALVALADDGNYLVTTVYGDWVVSPTSRTGRIWLMKIDNEGNTIWEKPIGSKERNVYLKNLRKTADGNLIIAGWAYNDTITEWVYEGLLYKFSQAGDSIWMSDYNHFSNQYDRNFFYDAYPTSDNGYIAIGKARPDMGDNNKMWIVKVDSMGCDTPGCFTTVISEEWFVKSEEGLRVWPNPTTNKFEVRSSEFEVGGKKIIRLYNSQGLKVEEIKVPDGVESMEVDVSKYTSGLYYLQYIHSNQIVETVKFIKN